MIYYSLSVLMLTGIRDILLINTLKDISVYKGLLGDGSELGINLSYAIQPNPDSLAQVFTIGEKFIGNSNVCLVLGDNIFYGQGFSSLLRKATNKKHGASVFCY